MSDVRYIARTGINYQLQPGPGEGRVEPGGDVPAYVIERSPWLLEQGLVTAEAAPTPLPFEPEPEPEGGDV